jgi:hypothetical protein
MQWLQNCGSVTTRSREYVKMLGWGTQKNNKLPGIFCAFVLNDIYTYKENPHVLLNVCKSA